VARSGDCGRLVVACETADGREVIVSLSGLGTRGGETADRRTLAAARWLMPSLPPGLIAEALGLPAAADAASEGRAA
jgi:hypothetical protein